MRRGAEYAKDLLESFGAKAKIYETRGHPIVYGRFDRSRDLPTVTVYNHLDVQPANRKKEPWRTEPFEFVKEGNRYFGRGTTDDKGPAMTALFGARYAYENGAAANIHFLWELEEEIGSPHFEETIRENAADFATDSVVVSDTVWVSRARPAQPAGLRGLQGLFFDLEDRGDRPALGHRGRRGAQSRHGDVPADRRMRGRQDRQGQDPGLLRRRRPPDQAGAAGAARAAASPSQDFKKDHLYKKLRVEDPLEVMKRIWMMPTFEVHGILGGYQDGRTVKTIIPPRATAIVSCRLVPNMNPKKVVKLDHATSSSRRTRT